MLARGWPDHPQKKKDHQMFTKQTRPPLFSLFQSTVDLGYNDITFPRGHIVTSKLSVQRENAWAGLLIGRNWLRLVG